MPFKKSYKKKAPRRRRMGRRRVMKTSVPRHISEKAGAQYSTLSSPLLPNSYVYAFRNFSLSGASDRVQSISKAYQFYRITKITWEVRPAYDTFQASAAGSPTSVPQLYWRMDRDGSFTQSTTLQTLKSAGCKPIRLDDKIIRKSFRPAVLQGVADQPGTASTAPSLVLGSRRISPWLPTNFNAYTDTTAPGLAWVASSIDHLGLLLCVDQDSGVNASTPCAYVSFTVEFEFKKPLEISPLGEGSLKPVLIETIKPGYVPPADSVS